MNRLISLALSVFLLLGVGCVCRAAPLPPQEEGSIQSSVLHTQAPPDEAAVPAEESVPAQEPADGADAPAEEETQPGETEEPYVRVIDPAGPMVALTFDDGPHEIYTDLILDVLEANHAVATFFEVGRSVAKYPQPLVRMDELGCEIASHSNAHRDLSKLKKRALLAELDAADQAFISAVGRAPTLVRPPYGAVNSTVKYASGRTMVTWTVDTEDWRSQDAQTVVDYVQSLPSLDGEIVLMHSTYESTAQAVAVLVPWLQEQGYQLVTVSELMAYYYGQLLEPDQFYGYTYFATTGRTDTPAVLPQEPEEEPAETPDPAGEPPVPAEEAGESPDAAGESPVPADETPAVPEEPAEAQPWAPYPEEPLTPPDTLPPGWLYA